ncbi:Inactive ubiquitin carboxyl-terminal hydrolase 54 [Takifugu flavidus]|uniref:Inactive ubiquitin carboxyl-terminal hydrolase 54 n=1 Tax=Takifugu flavidus TaxID=433684 RepID=A0A5C6PTC4_9TELE|nr:Inactive ubiquitin carboxyl-terminal hydrolase 54 [Takifugu flavidus]
MSWKRNYFASGGGAAGGAQGLVTPRTMTSIAPSKGLSNEPGQNSCFLNSALQKESKQVGGRREGGKEGGGKEGRREEKRTRTPDALHPGSFTLCGHCEPLEVELCDGTTLEPKEKWFPGVGATQRTGRGLIGCSASSPTLEERSCCSAQMMVVKRPLGSKLQRRDHPGAAAVRGC